MAQPSRKAHDFFIEGKRVELGSRLGIGGEGAVYELPSLGSNVVAKIYHSIPSDSKQAKLVAMSNGDKSSICNVACWPTEVIRSSARGPVVGFAMPKITGFEPLHKFYSPAERKQKFPNADWRLLIRAARNVAAAVEVIHQYRHVIGDINQNNIAVSNEATIKLIDCDSFQIQAERHIYRCEVGVAHFTPPELQDKKLDSIDRTINHDAFGLAVICFHLLFMGRHPFAGRFLGRGDMPIERAIKEHRFPYGAKASSLQILPPPNCLSLAHVSPAIANLFERAFASDGSNCTRPKANEWVRSLEDFEAAVRQCTSVNEHRFFGSSCAWCELESKAGVWFFITRALKQNTPLFSVNVEGLWNAIYYIKMRLPTQVPTFHFQNVVPKPIPDHFQQLLNSTIAGGFFSRTSARSTLSRRINSELTQKRQALSKAQQEQQRLERQFPDLIGEGPFKKTLESLQALKDEYARLKSRYSAEVSQIERNRRDSQLESFLDRFMIRDAGINGIGPGLTATLISYNIETAADLSPEKISQVPGFGDKRITDLMSWRRQKERKFIFNAALPIDPKVYREIDQRYRTKEEEIVRALKAGPGKLQELLTFLEARRKTVIPTLEIAAQTVVQLKADIEALERFAKQIPNQIPQPNAQTATTVNSQSQHTKPPVQLTAAPKVTGNPTPQGWHSGWAWVIVIMIFFAAINNKERRPAYRPPQVNPPTKSQYDTGSLPLPTQRTQSYSTTNLPKPRYNPGNGLPPPRTSAIPGFPGTESETTSHQPSTATNPLPPARQAPPKPELPPPAPQIVKPDQPNDAELRRNFDNCLRGYPICDVNLLSPEQLGHVLKNELARNLNSCLKGYPNCERKYLTADQIRQVETNELDRNLSSCLRGYPDCDKRKLAPEQLRSVHQNAIERNLQSCLKGYLDCNKALLSEEELSKVEDNELSRNLNNCLKGYLGCDKSRLSYDQRGSVEKNANERNLQICLKGYLGCNRALLSNEEIKKVEENELSRNLNNCLKGYLGCDNRLLNPDELERTKSNALSRNFNSCMRGYFGCDKSILTPQQLSEVNNSGRSR